MKKIVNGRYVDLTPEEIAALESERAQEKAQRQQDQQQGG